MRTCYREKLKLFELIVITIEDEQNTKLYTFS